MSVCVRLCGSPLIRFFFFWLCFSAVTSVASCFFVSVFLIGVQSQSLCLCSNTPHEYKQYHWAFPDTLVSRALTHPNDGLPTTHVSTVLPALYCRNVHPPPPPRPTAQSTRLWPLVEYTCGMVAAHVTHIPRCSTPVPARLRLSIATLATIVGEKPCEMSTAPTTPPRLVLPVP